MKQTTYYKSGALTANALKNLEAAKKIKIKCQYCERMLGKKNIARHEKSCKDNPANHKICPVCKIPSKFSGKTCSCSCANTFFRSGSNNPNAKPTSYRRVCFEHHKKECIVCGENNIVAVHHLDEDHSNNDPKNLIPLCPTHHQYLHSRYKNLIQEKIDAYVLSLGSRI